MEIIIQLIFIIAIVKYCLKASMGGGYLVIAAYATALALLAFALYPIVINQPLTIISELLTSRKMVEDMALIVSAEAILEIALAGYVLDGHFSAKRKHTLLTKVLKIIPGIIVFGAVAYFELQFFKARAGGDFLVTALIYSSILLFGVAGLTLFLKNFVSHETLKLEVKLILNFAILVLGLLVSSSVAEYNISNAQNQIEWGALIAIILLFAALVGLGVYLHKINFSKRINNILKWNK